MKRSDMHHVALLSGSSPCVVVGKPQLLVCAAPPCDCFLASSSRGGGVDGWQLRTLLPCFQLPIHTRYLSCIWVSYGWPIAMVHAYGQRCSSVGTRGRVRQPCHAFVLAVASTDVVCVRCNVSPCHTVWATCVTHGSLADAILREFCCVHQGVNALQGGSLLQRYGLLQCWHCR